MYCKTILPNGIRVVTEEMPYVHSVALGIWVGAGSRHETDENHGVSHFLEHLLFKGTHRRNAREIAEALESVGGVLNAFTTKEYTCFYTRVLAEYLDLAIDVLSDMFFNSRFDPEDIAKEKKVILEEIKMYEDSPDEIVHDLFAQTVWPGHPLGRAILGTYSSIQELQREGICGYYREHYQGGRIVLAAAGNFKTRDLEDRLAEAFGRRPLGEGGVPCRAPEERAAVSVNVKETGQIQICLGVPGLAQDHPDIYVLQALNNILGGGVSSRLFQLVREDRALAYSVYSYHAGYSDSGLFTVYAGTSPEGALEVIRLILEQMALIKQKGVTEAELKRTKDQIRGNLLLGQENVSQCMSRLGRTELCLGRVITVEETIERLSEVTVDDVQRVARQLFSPQRLSLTTLGPALDDDLDLQSMAVQAGL
ncbi:MAG: insulinase family protein [Thermoanaerobacteraceae bacterium]|nr:insulinase family protein [Thermoanaerobacteraceae bacterium]